MQRLHRFVILLAFFPEAFRFFMNGTESAIKSVVTAIGTSWQALASGSNVRLMDTCTKHAEIHAGQARQLQCKLLLTVNKLKCQHQG